MTSESATPRVIKLNYACTRAERDEAESLALRKQLGGGSKWLMWVVLLTLSGLGCLALWHILVREVRPEYRPYAIAGFIALVLFFFWKNHLRKTKEPEGTATIEISETGLTLGAGKPQVALPWFHFAECIETQNLFVLVERATKTMLILPKRVFPDQDSQEWLRSQITPRFNRPAPVLPGRLTLANGQDVTPLVLRFQLGYWDYLDRTLASWRIWGLLFAIYGLMIGSHVAAASNSPPNPVYSSTQIFFWFEVPLMLLLGTFVILLASVVTWRAHARQLVPMEIRLTADEMEISANGACESGNWSAYTCFKETRRSWIIWHRATHAWLLLPKRALQSPPEIELCRSLVTRNLRPSRWYFG